MREMKSHDVDANVEPASSGGRNRELAVRLAHLHHLSIAITFLFAVGRLFFINGCNGTILVCFVFPPAIALAVTIADDSRWNRRIAEWFLLAVAACVVNGWFDFLPGLFNYFPNLPLADNRVLSGYLFVYHVYLTGVVPPYVLIRAIWRHHCGQPAMFALGDISLERMVRAVEKVRDRLLRAAKALGDAGAPYAVAGGNAVAAWVSRIDEAAVRNTHSSARHARCGINRCRLGRKATERTGSQVADAHRQPRINDSKLRTARNHRRDFPHDSHPQQLARLRITWGGLAIFAGGDAG